MPEKCFNNMEIISSNDVDLPIVCLLSYEKVPGPHVSTTHRTREKIRKRGNLTKETIKYFEVNDAKFAASYIAWKIQIL